MRPWMPDRVRRKSARKLFVDVYILTTTKLFCIQGIGWRKFNFYYSNYTACLATVKQDDEKSLQNLEGLLSSKWHHFCVEMKQFH